MRKTLVLMMVTITAVAVAVEKTELMPLIETASTNREPSSIEVLPLRPRQSEPAREVIYHASAYVKMRNKIVEYGKDALPLLAEIAADENLPWQQQLVARICKERIERKKDIEKLLATDWRKHPNFNPEWDAYITGAEPLMIGMIIDNLREKRLWYYYLEVEWKMTSDKVKLYLPDTWVQCCTYAVKDSPERIWFLRVCDDLLETAPPLQLRRLSNILAHEEKPDTIDLREKYRAKLSVLTSPTPSYRDRLEARERAERLRPPVTEP